LSYFDESLIFALEGAAAFFACAFMLVPERPCFWCVADFASWVFSVVALAVLCETAFAERTLGVAELCAVVGTGADESAAKAEAGMARATTRAVMMLRM
jgi:hypothetical protein